MSLRRKTDYIVIHCSATPPTMNVDAAEIRRWHLARKFLDIGYHYVIKRDGTIEHGRAEMEVGAHVEHFNGQSVGICVVGGGVAEKGIDSLDHYTPAQWASLENLVLDLHERYPRAVVCGHRDFPQVAKTCPNFDVRAWWAKLPRDVPPQTLAPPTTIPEPITDEDHR